MERQESQKSEESECKQAGRAGKRASPPTSSSSSPASPSSSSPTHDFSFTISLHHSSLTSSIPDKSKPPPPSFALDLSPADDIFFHGHLLPLHLLSHLPLSPRSSTTSMDSFSLPLTHQNPFKDNSGRFSSSYDVYKSNISMDDDNHHRHESNGNNSNSDNPESNYNRGSSRGGSKSKSFSSIFGLTRGRKGCEVREKEENKEKHKRKERLDVVHVLKRYLRMVLFRGRRDEKIGFHGQPTYNSYSGNLSPRSKRDVVRGRRGEYSAPASMRTSPTNSGLLLATSTLAPPSDSTMEDLQAAIQAAIAHCKNSIAKEDKLKC